jgi:L-cystine uptake protein TcyP (sodium:dicarboxylate symporter family)
MAAPFSDLGYLFNELSNMIEEKILTKTSLRNNSKNYFSRSIARMILGTMFGIAIQIVLDPNDKEVSEALNSVQIIFQ